MSIQEMVANLVIEASCKFSEDKLRCYQRCISQETNEQTRWVMEQIVANAEASSSNRSRCATIPEFLIWYWNWVPATPLMLLFSRKYMKG